MLQQLRALQDVLTGQHDRLMLIKRHVRDDGARSAGEGRRR